VEVLENINKKGKVSLVCDIRAYRRSRGIASLTISTLDG
jgi:hypothetical protein